MSETFTKREVALLGEYIKEGYSLDNAIILLRGNPAAAVPAQRTTLGTPAETAALADDIEQSQGLLRIVPGIGTMSLGIKRTAMVVAALRSTLPSTERGGK